MCKDENVRIVIKQGSGVPTIPVSADHRNGDWITTDIYEGEQYQDTDTGIVYTRSSTGIEAVGGGAGVPLVYKAFLNQAGVADPTANILENTLGAIVWTRTNIGDYVGTLAGAFTSNKTVIIPPTDYQGKGLATRNFGMGTNNINEVYVYTTEYNTGTFLWDDKDAILFDGYSYIEITVYP